MRRILISVLSTLALVAALVAFRFIPPKPAHARPGNDVLVEYYSDATLSVIVGHYMLTCGGIHYTVGQVTEFYFERDSSCDPQNTDTMSVGCYVFGDYASCWPRGYPGPCTGFGINPAYCGYEPPLPGPPTSPPPP